MTTKHALKSKTIWIQIAAVVSALLPVAGDWLKSNPVEFVTVLAAVNVIVRFVTHGKVQIFTDKSGSAMLPIVVMIVTAVGLGSALPSCTALERVDVDGRVYYLHESGAKGGIDLVPGGKPRVFVRVPVHGLLKHEGRGRKVEAQK